MSVDEIRKIYYTEKGIEKGIEKGKEEVAIEALREGLDINLVSKISKLSIEKVKALKEKLN